MSEYIYATDDHGNQWVKWEPIVRCRDCEYYVSLLTVGGMCFLPDNDGDFARWEVEPDGFCAWGERRKDEQMRQGE